ncbi:hypothetical protein HYX13_03610, partial [Candidatus Woesearchaeota archaeon]|nr:hypothetical protein [Candidatus Woesearchaeota archaeon]
MDPLHRLVIETLQMNKQALVFVPSRASAEKTAEDLAKFAGMLSLQPELEQEILKAASTATQQCKRLALCIKKGIAFHHAGLLQQQKDLIEENFKSGKVKIICCTPTLCLSGDTEIWQSTESISIKKIKDLPFLFALSKNKLKIVKAKEIIKNEN